MSDNPGPRGHAGQVQIGDSAVSLALFDLAGRTALVTGSSRGLGRTMARGLARAGARVVLNGHILYVDGGILAAV